MKNRLVKILAACCSACKASRQLAAIRKDQEVEIVFDELRYARISTPTPSQLEVLAAIRKDQDVEIVFKELRYARISTPTPSQFEVLAALKMHSGSAYPWPQ